MGRSQHHSLHLCCISNRNLFKIGFCRVLFRSCLFFGQCHFDLHRITKSPELEWTLKDHHSPAPGLHRTPQGSHHEPESIIPTLLELCHVGAVTTSLLSLSQGPAILWVKNLSLISNLIDSPDSASCHSLNPVNGHGREDISASPPLLFVGKL